MQQWLIDETHAKVPELSMMQIAPEQGAFMTLLTGLIGAAMRSRWARSPGIRRCASPGASPSGGRLLCCDVSEEWTAIGREAWEHAGVADRIDLRIAPAIETLRALPTEQSIDLAFIDADKPSYPEYYEELLARLRPNGVILVDNMLWSGAVVDADVQDDEHEGHPGLQRHGRRRRPRRVRDPHRRRRPHPRPQALTMFQVRISTEKSWFR